MPRFAWAPSELADVICEPACSSFGAGESRVPRCSTSRPSEPRADLKVQPPSGVSKTVYTVSTATADRLASTVSLASELQNSTRGILSELRQRDSEVRFLRQMLSDLVRECGSTTLSQAVQRLLHDYDRSRGGRPQSQEGPTLDLERHSLDTGLLCEWRSLSRDREARGEKDAAELHDLRQRLTDAASRETELRTALTDAAERERALQTELSAAGAREARLGEEVLSLQRLLLQAQERHREAELKLELFERSCGTDAQGSAMIGASPQSARFKVNSPGSSRASLRPRCHDTESVAFDSGAEPQSGGRAPQRRHSGLGWESPASSLSRSRGGDGSGSLCLGVPLTPPRTPPRSPSPAALSEAEHLVSRMFSREAPKDLEERLAAARRGAAPRSPGAPSTGGVAGTDIESRPRRPSHKAHDREPVALALSGRSRRLPSPAQGSPRGNAERRRSCPLLGSALPSPPVRTHWTPQARCRPGRAE